MEMFYFSGPATSYSKGNTTSGKESKQHHNRQEQGQISLFFMVTIIISMTITVFVINVGLFVKARINMQNAVDAAAYAGASVQARQLTDIAYLNWEMRNTYKEWLFKYYVLGNLSNPKLDSQQANPPLDNITDFTLQPFDPRSQQADQLNVPSVCVFLQQGIGGGQRGNICRVYSTPGLPRLETGGGWGTVDQITSDAVDQLTIQQANHCSLMTQLNYTIATRWTYGTGAQDPQNPLWQKLGNQAAAAFDRPGSWVSAIEQAVRIRNLEAIVNFPPQANLDRNLVDSLSGDIRSERAVKAFYSAYRNLGNEFDSELKDSFILTELSPQPYSASDPDDLSNVLLPRPYEKFYLDLKLNIVNHTIFFTMFNPYSAQDAGTATDASCGVTKVGLPVPAYPMGFHKNPEVLTYYAVKGTAQFQGLFNPFRTTIKIDAYGSAKPMGARIGPQLFETSPGQPIVTSRKSAAKFRTANYVFGLDVSPGMENVIPQPIIPLGNAQFWLANQNDPIGGVRNTGAGGIKYVIPNLIYSGTNLQPASKSIMLMSVPFTPDNDMARGLYYWDEYQQFRGILDNITDGNTQITPEHIDQAIMQVRTPTQYEIKNYTIPTPETINLATGSLAYGHQPNLLTIFAPLTDPNLPFTGVEIIKDQVFRFFETQKESLQTYFRAISQAAMIMRSQSSSGSLGNSNLYEQAANLIDESMDGVTGRSCQSLAGRSYYFFLGDESGVPASEQCPPPLSETILDYFNNPPNNMDPSNYQRNYVHPLYERENLQKNQIELAQIFNAYGPGQNQGADINANVDNPFLRRNEGSFVRNAYSTKFIPLSSISRDINGRYYNAPIYQEGLDADAQGGIRPVQNSLRPGQVPPNLSY